MTDSDASSSQAMVTSPHVLASEAGRDVLRAGGNAIEAAVAMGAVLSVTYPHFCGIGGDAVWMIADREGRATCLLGIGQAISASDRVNQIDTRGPGSVLTTACAVDSWGAALDHAKKHWHGGASLADLLQPAIDYAEDGYHTTASQTHWLDFRRDQVKDWPGFALTFIDPLPAVGSGDSFRQPALADSLRRIAANGVREFYEGELAERISDGVAATGATLSANDLAATRTREVEPLRLDYNSVTLLAPPLPTQGVTTLAIMGILNRLNLSQYAEGSADHFHCCVEAVKRAFHDRDGIGDPAHSDQPIADWLAPERLAAKAAGIDMGHALGWPQKFRTGDTVFFAATDAMGRSASVLQSIYFDWGSGVVAGDTGILWHNRGAAFNLVDGHPNRLRPGRLPFYTLNPGIALRDGRPHLLYGTQGADGQPQTLAMLLSRVLDYGLSPAEALARPRFLLGRTFSDQRDSLKLERDAGPSTLAYLAARGHEVVAIDTQSPLAGQAGMIRIDVDGSVTGAHDPRSDGVALSP